MPGRTVAHPRLALGVFLAAAVSALVPMAASAQQTDDERARAHFLAGRSYMDQARYDDAAEQFQEAYRLSHRPEMLVNASTAYERALRFDEAVTTLEQYLEVQPDAADRLTLEERLGRLRELRDRAAATRAAEAAAAAEPAVDAPIPAPEPVPSAPEVSTDDGLGEVGIIGIVLGGAGVAALVVSLATGIVAHATHQSLQVRCGPDGLACPPGSQGEIDSGGALALTSTVMTFAGIALLGAGVALLVVDLTSGSSSGERETARLRIAPGGVGLEGSF